MLAAGCHRAVNGAVLQIDGNHGFGTRPAGRPAKATEFGDDIRHMPREHASRLGRKAVQIERGFNGVPDIRVRRIAQGPDTPIADPGKPVEGRQGRRIDSEFPGTTIHEQPPPSVGQTIVKNSVHPLEYRRVVRREGPAGNVRAMVDWRDFQVRGQKAVVVLEAGNAVDVSEPSDRLNVTIVPPQRHRQQGRPRCGPHVIRPRLRAFGWDSI